MEKIIKLERGQRRGKIDRDLAVIMKDSVVQRVRENIDVRSGLLLSPSFGLRFAHVHVTKAHISEVYSLSKTSVIYLLLARE